MSRDLGLWDAVLGDLRNSALNVALGQLIIAGAVCVPRSSNIEDLLARQSGEQQVFFARDRYTRSLNSVLSLEVWFFTPNNEKGSRSA